MSDVSNVTESVTLANADIDAIIGERRHDPLCQEYFKPYAPGFSNDAPCTICDLIARVREDERGNLLEAISWVQDPDEALDVITAICEGER